MSTSEPAVPTLFAWAGGEPALRRFVDAFYDRVERDALPADPEFRAAVMGYVEWGTRLAQHNSQPDAHDVVTDAPVPRWGWGVAPPYDG